MVEVYSRNCIKYMSVAGSGIYLAASQFSKYPPLVTSSSIVIKYKHNKQGFVNKSRKLRKGVKKRDFDDPSRSPP